MKKKFRHYIEENHLFNDGSRILLAVSGGVDSMVMLNLFHQCGFNYAIAHCNFHLRGNESDEDEAFVRNAAKMFNAEIFVSHFNTTQYAVENRISIQVAARNLRYSWFAELCETKGFDAIAVAHNSNDVAETVLINLVRGTGIKGLTGIKPKGNSTIRPLLFASRKEIEQFAFAENIESRTDSSNSDTKYTRNRIRNIIIPEFEELNSAFVRNVVSTSHYASQAWEVACEEIENFRKKVRTQVDNETHYSIEMLKEYRFTQLFLAEEFIPNGFDSTQIAEIEKSLFTQPGKVFYSASYMLVRDRKSLILTPSSKQINYKTEIQLDTKKITEPLNLSFEIIFNVNEFDFTKEKEEFFFDLDSLSFPLIIRNWKPGDWFIPFGMKGKKKVSDFLVDQKVPLHQKEGVFVLESAGSIICILGYRIDERYRITKQTKTVWKVTVND